MSKVMFDKIALIGIGLIGGSIALAARRGGLANKIVAATRRQETADIANKLKLADHCGTDLAAACASRSTSIPRHRSLLSPPSRTSHTLTPAEPTTTSGCPGSAPSAPSSA